MQDILSGLGQWANCNHGNHRRDPGVPQNAHEAEVGWYMTHSPMPPRVLVLSKHIPQSNVTPDVQTIHI